MRLRFYLLILSSFFLVSLFSACSKKNFSGRAEYNFKSKDGRPHYEDLHYWAAHPWKWDPSDSVPRPLRNSHIKDSTVDVFFIYPTTLTDRNDMRWNAAIDDSLLNAKTDYSTILLQASAFNEQTRIFAPRYRQAHYRAFTTHDSAKASAALDLAYEDVKASFEYYLKNLNHGRPVIIAAHSQGTIHAGRLLKDFFEGKLLMNKLICAYLIGMPVAENYFSSIPYCKDSLGTGCFVSWRSFKKGYAGDPYILQEKYKSVVVNPLSWTRGTEYVPASKNKGAVLLKFNKIGKGVSAQVHDNILWTAKPKFFGNIFLTKKNYHIADINLFYVNIREDVKRRIGLFWKG